MEIDFANLGLAAAFLIGLAHTLEPCEDKAIVSLFVIWSARRLSHAIGLVVLYGLGMALADTVLGLVFSWIGVNWLESLKVPLEVIAGAITLVLGVFMLRGKELSHIGHHHGEHQPVTSVKVFNWYSVLGLGIVRGLPPCPIEVAVLVWAASIGNVWYGTATVFVFGLGTTAGLIPLGLVMGGISRAVSRTRYASIMPKVVAALMIALGLILVLVPFLGIEL